MVELFVSGKSREAMRESYCIYQAARAYTLLISASGF